MHPSVVRERLILGQRKLVEIAAELAEMHGIEGLDSAPYYAHDVEERSMLELESIVSFMERLRDRGVPVAGVLVDQDAMDQTEVDKVDITSQAKDALYQAGFTRLEQVNAATDDELLAVPGVGPATVAKLREAVVNAALAPRSPDDSTDDTPDDDNPPESLTGTKDDASESEG